MPSVLLGITTRNRASVLVKAVTSALAQDYPTLQVAIIDDASTDGTPNLRAQFPSVTWIRQERIRGLMANRNELMHRSGFEYYVSLDDDAWFLCGDEVSRAVERMQSAPGVAGIAFDILSPDRPERTVRSHPRRVSIFIGCGHVLRLSAVAAAGYYAKTPGSYGSEEKDLSLRLANLGYEIELLPGVHVWHEKAWDERDNRPLHRSGVCNEMVMTLRRCPLPDVLLVLPLKLVSYLWFWVRQPFYFSAGLRGLADFLRHFGAAWRSRHPVRRKIFWRRKFKNRDRL